MAVQHNFKIAIWNANGLLKHTQELISFLTNHNIDIMLISESHFTNRHYFRIPKYKIYDTKHPDGKAHGGTAVIIRDNILHHEREKFSKDFLQATSVIIEDELSPLTISAIYCPPKHNNKKEDYEEFFQTLGNKFIVGGDYNAKHPRWGSRLTTSKGRELVKAMDANNLKHISTSQPTYWPSDRKKTPDILDFCVTKGIDTKRCEAESCLDLSSDHSPILITIYSQILNRDKQPSLHSKRTDWNLFRHKLDDLITLRCPLKTEMDIETAIHDLTINIQEAAWFATPLSKTFSENEEMPYIIKQKIAEKRHLRKLWQFARTADNKRKFNKAVKELKEMQLEMKNQNIQRYLESLTPTVTSDYSLWRATRRLKRPQQTDLPIKDENNQWARNDKQKTEVFVKHLKKVFEPFQSEVTAEDEDEIKQFLETPFQMEVPIKKIKISEVKSTILKEINIKKAPGFDLITGKVLRELSAKCIKLITFIYNAILQASYFPHLWKVAQIVMILKPGKKAAEATSYRPISLLPMLSKVFEKIYVKRLKLIIDERKLIPAHQFGFRNKHGTIEQIHRIVDKINSDLEAKRFCSAAFLDLSQAFDRVWHTGLYYKLRKNLPHPHYQLIKSYLTNRHFLVKQNNNYSDINPIQSGVPQGSVLGPILYLLYTSDLPTTSLTTVATYADDTAVLASHIDPSTASRYLQDNLNKIQDWLKKWRLKANESKSMHITFTMRKGSCPPVIINNCQLPQANDVKYLGMHLDRRLTWHKHIITKRKQLGLKLSQMYWIIGRRSQLSLDNKILLYKAILKPVWTYGIQLWGTTCNSNIAILQRFQNKVLRAIVDAPRYMPNSVIQRDIQIASVSEVIAEFSAKYRKRVLVHPSLLARELFERNVSERRLKRFIPSDLTNRFSQ